MYVSNKNIRNIMAHTIEEFINSVPDNVNKWISEYNNLQKLIYASKDRNKLKDLEIISSKIVTVFKMVKELAPYENTLIKELNRCTKRLNQAYIAICSSINS